MVPDPDRPGLTAIVSTEALLAQGLKRPVVLEIGFGRGEFLLELAGKSPDQEFLGVEVSRKRVEKVARRAARLGLSNIRLVHAPAEYLIERVLPTACVAACWINCPDPWPKKRHHKRRLLNPGFVTRLARVLEPGATLYVSTDHAGYATWMDEALSQASSFENLHGSSRWSRQRPERIETAYEAEWLAEGRTLAYFDYRRRMGTAA